MNGSYLGPEWKDADIASWIADQKLITQRLDDEVLFQLVAKYLSEGLVVGWFQGKMEFGPRALGNRSILGDPRSEQMQKVLNLKIKFRESFRPFAPSVLQEKVSEYFDFTGQSPYMLMVAPIKEDKRQKNHEHKTGFDKLYQKRSDLPAITHVDYSARIQTVSSTTNPRYHALISEFFKRTGIPVLINTSFNVRGEPIVCSPDQAYTCFIRTNMDVLVIGNYLFLKSEQPKTQEDLSWQSEFELD
jgi:carbamoyltransferase